MPDNRPALMVLNNLDRSGACHGMHKAVMDGKDCILERLVIFQLFYDYADLSDTVYP